MENLRAPLYVHQTITENADSSDGVSGDQRPQTSACQAGSNGDHVPNTEPIILGINLNLGFTMILHRLKAFTGIGEKVVIDGVLANADASDRDSLASERVAK